jgi:hypothetical protein
VAAGDEHVRVRQRPVAVLAADLEAALVGAIAQRTAVRQLIEIVNLEADRHDAATHRTPVRAYRLRWNVYII